MGVKTIQANLCDYPDVLLVKEVMVILRVGRKEVYRLIKDGELNGRILAGGYRITKKSMTAFIAHLEDAP